jgi:hypothetical protein
VTFDRCEPLHRRALRIVERTIAVDEDDDLGPIVTIDLRAVRIRMQECEGDLVLLVDDGDVEVEFGSGVGGTFEQAIFGAERLASTALAYAQALRGRRPNRPPKQVATQTITT